MAFFLLMWLVASLNKAQKAGIAEYFKQPMKVALFGGKAWGIEKQRLKEEALILKTQMARFLPPINL
ncbi:hypothetical protein PGH44_02815 [Legionella pneumophila]|nr:hypothetical protein PGH44_02815 [Legionella pneumophila]